MDEKKQDDYPSEKQSKLPRIVIGIGASAGGLDALERFFKSMPANKDFAFVVIQHLSPDFKSLMDDLLARHTKMSIRRVEDRMPIDNNTIYLIPPRKLMTIEDNNLRLLEKDPKSPLEFPIDIFFNSLAENYGPKAIGIILSGTGSDGSKGIKAIFDNQGTTMVQDPETAQFDGMPLSAISSECVDYVLSPEEMASTLVAFAKDPGQIPNKNAKSAQNIPDEYQQIFSRLQEKFKLDFSLYKSSTIKRRIQRRMALGNIYDIDSYTQFILSDPHEADKLYRDLLIGVTSFFRDRFAFSKIQEEIIPNIFDKKETGQDIRIWVAGCATGEEAYSLAIILLEEKEKRNFQGKITVFATDVHRRSLEQASAGIFSQEQLANINPERLKRFFVPEAQNQMRVSNELRNLIIFAPHNLIANPPLRQMDLISCRNLLIYLRPGIQEKIISLFNFSLINGGYLLLGSSEGLGKYENNFNIVDKKAKIFTKTKDIPLQMNFQPFGYQDKNLTRIKTTPSVACSQDSEHKLLPVYDQLLSTFMPPGILMDEDKKIIHIFGDAHKFLQFKSGRINDDLLSLMPENMRLALYTAIKKAASIPSGQHVLMQKVPGEKENEQVHVDIELIPVSDSKNKKDYFLASFNTHSDFKPKKETKIRDDQYEDEYKSEDEFKNRIKELEDELNSTREALQATIEELQTTNEELQASNEELQASNEELQSTNEELHSVNEELYTVNAEYERKNKELQQLDQDHENLLKSIDSGILFLDSDLRIRKFSPAINKMFKLMDQDIGRPIEHIASQGLIDHGKLFMDIRKALDSGHSHENIIMTKNGHWLLMRIHPFKDDNEENINGTVLTFTNITSLKQAQLAQQKTEQRYKAATESSTDAFFWLQAVKNAEDKVIDFNLLDLNNKAEELIGKSSTEAIGYNLCSILPGQCKDERFLPEYIKVYESGTAIERKIKIDDPDINADWLHQRVIRIGDGIAITTSDISEDYSIREDLQNAKEAAEKANKAKTDFLAVMSHELRTPLNAIIGFCDLLLESELNEEQNEFSQIIKESGQNLLVLIGDILELSKIESGKIELNITPIQIRHMLEQNLKSFAPMADKKGIDYNFSISENMPTLIASDAGAIRQIVLNIVNNAIKYTPAGTVQVNAASEKSPAGNDMLKITVSDTGIGIDLESQDNIFDPFSQADNSLTRQFGGTGLGLAISRKLANQLHGEIIVNSTPEKGSVFTFYMPITHPHSQAHEIQKENFHQIDQSGPQNSLNILIAEDDPVNQKLIRTFLKMLGHDFKIASNGEEAIGDARETDFDLILMDLHMPVKNGLEATKQILDEMGDKAPSIIALTADAQKEVVEECRKAGMVDYITKPFEKETLQQILARWGTRKDEQG